ncbi:MerR family transcriptional regulator [Pandoraea morbifera]|uniref:MerR family transcriptional regulator n=1 Tax=Pandoraea morbifera TaxID=2508300 RepID=A0A5E4SQC0_9BURK|nr:MerR family transcriptional regulator [Pandoraea morbifera]VVD77103.1 MerR family transcriptional regulator [Pandoraea morbifera]
MSTSAAESGHVTVREAAERLGVTPRTLKYYEEKGLIVPTRSEGHYRLYTQEDLEKFVRILRMRSLGFSLQTIAEILSKPIETSTPTSTAVSLASLREVEASLVRQVEAVDARIQAVRKEMREAMAVRDEIEYDLQYIRRRIAGEPKDALIRERRERALAKRGTGQGTPKARKAAEK